MGTVCRFLDSGGVYKLAFGPKAFIVVSDPVVVRHLLKVHCFTLHYCKYMLSPAASVHPSSFKTTHSLFITPVHT